jgi:N-acetylmuramoyl-L-alanine amidase
MQNITNIYSPNFDPRPTSSIDHVILHYTEISFDETIKKFSTPEKIVSAHYVIREDGIIFQCVPDELRARHAGVSHFRGRNNFNDFSIGIEIVNSGRDSFPAIQMQSCIDLCLSFKKKYNIPAENFLGHSDIAPTRKIDPGLFFDWKLLRKYDLGIPFAEAIGADLDQILFSQNNNLDGVKELQQRLKTFGYDIAVTGVFDKQTSDVIRAFQSHFAKESIIGRFNTAYYNLSIHPTTLSSSRAKAWRSQEVFHKTLTHQSLQELPHRSSTYWQEQGKWSEVNSYYYNFDNYFVWDKRSDHLLSNLVAASRPYS